MKEIISFFSNLRVLEFELWSTGLLGYVPELDIAGPKILIPEDIQKAHAKEWTIVCPELLSVAFTGHPPLDRDVEDEWV